MGTPRWHSAQTGLVNILIGLGRGYAKEKRRVKRICEGKPDGFERFVAWNSQERYEFVELLVNRLGDYYPDHSKRILAAKILEMIDCFHEER